MFVVNEFHISQYAVLTLYFDIPKGKWNYYRIGGAVYERVPVHYRTYDGTSPRNVIAIVSDKSHLNQTVEFLEEYPHDLLEQI